MASQHALEILKDENSAFTLSKICDCKAVQEAVERERSSASQRTQTGDTEMTRSDSMLSDLSTSTSASTSTTIPPGSPTSFTSQSPTTSPTPRSGLVTPLPAAAGFREVIGGPITSTTFASLAGALGGEEEADIQEQNLILESLIKDEISGDFLDNTEHGFAARAKVAADLFDPDESGGTGAGTSVEGLDLDELDEAA